MKGNHNTFVAETARYASGEVFPKIRPIGGARVIRCKWRLQAGKSFGISHLFYTFGRVNSVQRRQHPALDLFNPEHVALLRNAYPSQQPPSGFQAFSMR